MRKNEMRIIKERERFRNEIIIRRRCRRPFFFVRMYLLACSVYVLYGRIFFFPLTLPFAYKYNAQDYRGAYTTKINFSIFGRWKKKKNNKT